MRMVVVRALSSLDVGDKIGFYQEKHNRHVDYLVHEKIRHEQTPVRNRVPEDKFDAPRKIQGPITLIYMSKFPDPTPHPLPAATPPKMSKRTKSDVHVEDKVVAIELGSHQEAGGRGKVAPMPSGSNGVDPYIQYLIVQN
uniref:Uncharacterized protein n=1 Tax=Cannabis sativa TaxID=3483 RepID=A0A803PRE9_CANSA